MNTELPMFYPAFGQIDFNDTEDWTIVESDRNNQIAMDWLSDNCDGVYYKYYQEGGYYVKFSLERDAIMFRLKWVK